MYIYSYVFVCLPLYIYVCMNVCMYVCVYRYMIILFYYFVCMRMSITYKLDSILFLILTQALCQLVPNG